MYHNQSVCGIHRQALVAKRASKVPQLSGNELKSSTHINTKVTLISYFVAPMGHQESIKMLWPLLKLFGHGPQEFITLLSIIETTQMLLIYIKTNARETNTDCEA